MNIYFTKNLQEETLQVFCFPLTISSMNERSPSPKPNPTRSRQQIVSAAHRLFLTQGYHGTTMRQIAKESGMALGSLYNHFADKEALFKGVFEAYNPYPLLLMALEHSQGKDAEDLVRVAARRLVTALKDRPDLIKLVFIDVVEFQGRHLAAAYPDVAPGMERFVIRLQRDPSGPSPRGCRQPAARLLWAFLHLPHDRDAVGQAG